MAWARKAEALGYVCWLRAVLTDLVSQAGHFCYARALTMADAPHKCVDMAGQADARGGVVARGGQVLAIAAVGAVGVARQAHGRSRVGSRLKRACRHA